MSRNTPVHDDKAFEIMLHLYWRDHVIMLAIYSEKKRVYENFSMNIFLTKNNERPPINGQKNMTKY